MNPQTKKIRVAVIYGGPGDEREVSISSGQQVIANLNSEMFSWKGVLIDQDQNWHFDDKTHSLEEALQKIKQDADIVFIALHGEYGEDGFIQAVLEREGIKYTGSNSESSANAYNKLISREIFAKEGLTQPQVYESGKEIFPCVVKPVFGGSSVGVEIVKDKEQLANTLDKNKRQGIPVLVQEYISGREFTCGVLEKEKGEPRALMPTEIIPNNASFFDYEAKYVKGASTEVTPPNLNSEQIAKLQQLALAAHEALGCLGMSRSDFIFKDDKFYLLETNTIPGLTETSLLPQGAAAVGIGFSELLEKIIKAAL